MIFFCYFSSHRKANVYFLIRTIIHSELWMDHTIRTIYILHKITIPGKSCLSDFITVSFINVIMVLKLDYEWEIFK